MGSEKTCSKCGVTRPLSEFYKRPGGRVNPWCKICYKAWYAARNGGVVQRNCDYCAAPMTVTGRRASESRVFCSRPCKDNARNAAWAADNQAKKPTERHAC